MATAAAVAIQWIPEDDLLLKNSVEAGASLEALAKGAVLFSRRYTLRELQERWHSLLYDPNISAQAAVQIFELEISGFNSTSRFNRFDIGSKEGPRKRKTASIRRQYLAMRKKFRSELFGNSSLGFFEPNPHEFNERSADFQKQVMQDGDSCMIGDGIPDHLGLHEEDLDILRHAFPGTVMEITANVTSSLTEGVNNMVDLDIRNGKHPLTLRESPIDENPHNLGFEGCQQFIPLISDRPNLYHWKTIQDASASSVPLSMGLQEPAPTAEGTTVCTGEFADPDSLLNLSNEDEMSEDVDEKYPPNKCLIYNTGSVVQDSIEEGRENDTAKTELELVEIAEVIPATVSSPKPTVSNSHPEVNTSSKSSSISYLTGRGDGKIWCPLNTEDTEIPCNDDIFLLIHPSTSFGPSSTQPNTTFVHEEDYEQALNFSMIANNSAKDVGWPHMGSMHGLPQSLAEIHDSRPQASISGFLTKTATDSSKGGSPYAIPKQCSNSLAKKEVPGADIKVGQSLELVNKIIRSTEAGSARSQHTESVVDDSVSDDEESEIDDEVPCFSDIEAMILEVDLDPYDRDSSILRQVLSYQYDDTKRTIIRLEQGARSCLQRAMTSQEALAILYGHHLRHYIRKPEVLLGRSTDDIDVDIDLSKEGRANKISRRQAIIKMEADGSFFLKNLGKSSVSVNGIAVAPGHSLNLNTNCLIEIKGMSFVFEINQDYIRKHLGKFCLKSKGKTGKSDRSAEDES